MTQENLREFTPEALIQLTVDLMIILGENRNNAFIDALAAAREDLNDEDQELYEGGTVVLEESL